MSLKGEKSLMVVLCIEGILLHYNKRLCIMHGGDDDAIVIVEINRPGVLERGIQYI